MKKYHEHPDRHFWDKIHKPSGESGCWEYTGSLNAKGYGALCRRGVLPDGKKAILAHRYAYMFLVGPIPHGLHLDHLCRNAKCCNPAHLEPVSHRENVLRGESGWGVRGTCNNGHKRTRRNMRCNAGLDGVIIVTCKDCQKEYRTKNAEKIRGYMKRYKKSYSKRKSEVIHAG